MTDTGNSSFDEDAAIEAAQERSAAPHLRDILKQERDEILKGRARAVALEKWESEFDAMTMRDLNADTTQS